MPQCPSCQKQMREVREANVAIDVCNNCHGVWLDAGELEQLADAGNLVVPAGSRPVAIAGLQCPHCAEHDFSLVNYAKGGIAVCKACRGTFINGETLDRIARAENKNNPFYDGANTLVNLMDFLGAILSCF